jgi:hypothetical protein
MIKQFESQKSATTANDSSSHKTDLVEPEKRPHIPLQMRIKQRLSRRKKFQQL